MKSLYAFGKRKRSAHTADIRPGWVGPLGETNMQTQWKQTAPYDPPRFDPRTSGQNEIPLGNNVTDGMHGSWLTGATGAEVTHLAWNNHKRKIGWEHQDIIAPDKRVEPFIESQYSARWQNQMEGLTRDNGKSFLPGPGPFQLQPGEMPRGGMYPRVTGVSTPKDEMAGKKAEKIAKETSVLEEALVQRMLGTSSSGRSGMGNRAPGPQPTNSPIVGAPAVREGGLEI